MPFHFGPVVSATKVIATRDTIRQVNHVGDFLNQTSMQLLEYILPTERGSDNAGAGDALFSMRHIRDILSGRRGAWHSGSGDIDLRLLPGRNMQTLLRGPAGQRALWGKRLQTLMSE